jgi:hypothetical protein
VSHVLDVLLQVGQSSLQRVEVFRAEILLVRTAVHLERPYRCDDHRRLGLQAPRATLDVEELLRAEIGPEARLRNDNVTEGQRRPRRENAVTAMGDVAEGASMHERRSAFERLYEIRTNGVLEEQRHGSRRAKLACSHRTTS